jgi:hypothetical protein
VADLAGLDELLDRARDVLDRDVGVDPVLVKEVDHVGAQPAQGCVGDPADLLRPAVETHRRAVLDVPAELRGDDDLVTQGLQGLADELFVDVGAVNLGGVEERDAALHRATQDGDHVLAGAGVGAVALGHPHAAEADGGHLEALAECADVQCELLGRGVGEICGLGAQTGWTSSVAALGPSSSRWSTMDA